MFTKKSLMNFLIAAPVFVGIQLGLAFFTAQKAAAQTAGKENKENKETKVSPEVKEKALKLLKAVARETQQFAAPENRIRAATHAADLLWDSDEAAARKLFQTALSEMQTIFNSLPAPAADGEESAVDSAKDNITRYNLSELRRQFLTTLASRDPKAALAALQTLKTQSAAANGADYDPLQSEDLELQIASAVAVKDPQKAYDLAAQKVKDAITYGTFETLSALYKENPELGAKLARDILARFKSAKVRINPANSDTSISGEGATFTYDLSMLSQFVTTVAALNRQGERQKDKKTRALTDGEMRELSDTIVAAFNRQRTTEFWSIASAMPYIAKYSPNAATQVRRRLNPEQIKTLEMYGENNYYEQRDEKTLDELLADAEKVAAPADRDARYADVVLKALENDKLEKAEEAAKKISVKKNYEYIFDQIKTQTPIIKARRGDVSEVRKMLANLKTDDEKVQTLSELVLAVADKDKKAAAKLVDEANQFLPSQLKRKNNLDSTLRIAGAYAAVRSERAFALIENSVAQMNDLINAGVLIDDFYDYGSLSEGEITYDVMERQGVLHTTNQVLSIKNLAETDFDRTVSLSDKFSRPEIRMYVRLKIAEALLDPKAEEKEKILREQSQNRGTE
jgi:hypothetical protein